MNHPPKYLHVYEYEGYVAESEDPCLMGIWREAGYSFVFVGSDSQDHPLDPRGARTVHVVRYQDWLGGEYEAVKIGRFLIRPPWVPSGVGAPFELIIDPNVVFGSGLHPSTSQCLMAMEGLDSHIKRAVDLGTGTGILAIALARMDIHVLAVDNNPLCVEVARKNCALNRVEGLVEVVKRDVLDLDISCYDLVVANLGPELIQGVLKRLKDPGCGALILSGITRSFVGAIKDLLAQKGYGVSRHLDDGIWHTLLAKRVIDDGA